MLRSVATAARLTAADAAEPCAVMAQVRQAYVVLTAKLWPHENAEEKEPGGR